MEERYGADQWTVPEGVETLRAETTAYYAVQAPGTGVAPGNTLLALHGWGQNCRSFLRRFAALQEAGTLVIAPQGPHQQYLDMETRKVGFSWITSYDRLRAVPDLVEGIDRVLARVRDDHSVNAAPFVLGFSQGVSIGYRYALLGAAPVAGMIACGGDLPPDVAQAMEKRAPFPILLVHGTEDSIVPVAKFESAATQLRELGWPFETCLFEGSHEIPATAIGAIRDWMDRHGPSL